MLIDDVEPDKEHACKLLEDHIKKLKPPTPAADIVSTTLGNFPIDAKSAVVKMNQATILLFRILSALTDPDADLPKLTKNDLDKSIEDTNNAIQKLIDTNDSTKANDAVKTDILHKLGEKAKSICVHVKHFLKTFLSVAIQGSAVRSAF